MKDYNVHARLGRCSGFLMLPTPLQAEIVEQVQSMLAAASTPAAAIPAAPSAGLVPSKMEVDSWRRALLVWRDAGISELIEDRAGLKQCLSNAARLLLDHPALTQPTTVQQAPSADKRGFWQNMDPWLTEFIGEGGSLVKVLYNEPLDAIDRSSTGSWIQTAIEVFKKAHSNDAARALKTAPTAAPGDAG